jgi:hypothetical protein
VGTARVWDEGLRALRASRPPVAPPPPEAPGSVRLVLPAEELAALVSGIVRVTLDTRLAGALPEHRAALARELEARLVALFGGPPAQARAQECAPEAAPEAAPLEPEGPLAALPPGPLPSVAPAERALGLVIEDRLLRLGGDMAARADLRERLIGIALQWLASAPAAASASGEELRSLDVLQRRAAKLEHSLKETRAALAYVSGLEHVDSGIASIYRTVQGLAIGDPERERKREALECLFQANLALQKPLS